MQLVLTDTLIFLREGSIWSWLSAIAASVLISLALRVILGRLGRRLDGARIGHSDRRWNRLLVDGLATTRFWVICVWVFAGFMELVDHHGRVDRLLHLAQNIATCYQLGVWAWRAVDNWYELSRANTGPADVSSSGALNLLSGVLKGILLSLIVLVGLSNAGIDVRALVASFGIGGVAVALASRNILEDLLSAVSIILDRPFAVGDSIMVGDKSGTVETIGIKTTRVRANSGEQLIFSNKDLLGSRIQNFRRMWQRRVQLKFSVPYSTPVEKLEKIPDWIREFICGEPKFSFERCHLSGYGTYSIDIELVYLIQDPDFNLYMDLQQKLLLNIKRKFQQEGVEFAVPLQRLEVEEGSPVPFVQP